MSDSEEKVVESKKDKKKDKKKAKAEAEPVEEAPVEEEPVKTKKLKKSKAVEEEPAPVADEPEEKPAKSDKKSKKEAPAAEVEEKPVEEDKPSKKDKKKDAKKEEATPPPAEPKKKEKAPEPKPTPVEEPKKKDTKKDEGKKKGKEEVPEVKEKVAASKKAPVDSDDEEPAPKKKPEAKPKKPVQESESEEEDDEPDNRKKLLIIGATGSVGQVLLNHTLREQTKYAVFPMVRKETSLTVQQRSLSADVIVGQCTKKEDVENAVDGVDAVFVCLGHREDSPADLIQSTVKNVLDAMKKLKVHRLIVLAHAAINDYGDKNTISRKLLKTMKGASDKAVLADLEKTSGLLETEGGTIDWIVVRPPKLTSDPIEAKGKYKTGKLDLGPTDKISRADVAHFLLSCVTDDTFIRKRPMVSY